MVSLIIVIYIIFISLGLPDSLFGTAWPLVHLDMDVPLSFASIYTIIVSICTSFINFVAGKLIRKIGTGLITFLSICFTIIGMVGISFAPNIWVMMFFSMLLSLGGGVIDTALNNYVSIHYSAKHMSWLHCFWGVGVTMSPIIISFFMAKGEWRSGYRAIALIQSLIAALAFVNIKNWKNITPVANVERKETGKRPTVKNNKALLFSYLSMAFYTTIEFVAATWFASYLVKYMQLTPDVAARWVSLYFGGIMLGRLTSGFISDAVGDKRMIMYGVLLSMFGMFSVMLSTHASTMAGMFIIGLGFAPVFPSVIHAIPSRFGVEYAVDLTGFHMGIAYVAGFTSQAIFGFLATATGFVIMPYYMIIFAICSGACNLLVYKFLKK
ncbi:MAG: MFS transporter [Christensenellaceae bacterium]|nr:MFS transporter [Christensenellaceae bacterium]